MQDAFGYVLFGVVAVGVVVALVTFVLSANAYDEIGKGGFFSDEHAPKGPPAGSSADLAERDAEVRQMLEARNARRAAAGRDVVDVEDELSRLTAPVIDEGIRQEVRDMVVARNNRRMRRGQEPLDVEAEVQRRVRELQTR